jgi:hypothetical protein
MIHLTANNINGCFKANSLDTDECIIIFGVYAGADKTQLNMA